MNFLGEILSHTASVCPVCLKRLEALYLKRNGAVFLAKECPEHGPFDTLVWDDAAHWADWFSAQGHPEGCAAEPPPLCPHGCAGCHSHRQRTCCVLLEVTGRCNLHCPVCFAAAGGSEPDPPLSVIEQWYTRLARDNEPYNIQLSGGEPTLRDDLPQIIALGREKGFSFFQLNTNGLRLAQEPRYLKKLVQAGLNTVFLQFDGFEPQTGHTLRGAHLLAEKLQAIQNCAKAGVGVTLVPTLHKGLNLSEVGHILNFALAHMPGIRAVHFQPVSFFGRCGLPDTPQNRLTLPEVLREIERQTDGRIKAADFTGGGAEHPHCSFHAHYTLAENGQLTAQKSAASCCSSAKARDATARVWSLPPPLRPLSDELSAAGIRTDSMDAFILARQTRTLAISGMAFMDAWTLDLQRLCRCYIHIVRPDGQRIPFCAYNLTAQGGPPLYRKPPASL